MASKQDLGADAIDVIVARARTDSAFRATLLANGNQALAALGIPVPPGVTVTFVQDTQADWHFVIPEPRADNELQDGDLDRVAGGMAPAQLRGVKF